MATLHGLIALVPSSGTHEVGIGGKPQEQYLGRKPRVINILICASSAITSAITLLYLSRLLRRRRKKLIAKDQPLKEPKLPEEPSAQEQKYQTAAAKVKELEAALCLTQLEKELQGKETGEALRKLTAAANSEKELRHQLGKVRFAAKELEDSYNALHSEKEAALAKAKTMQEEKKRMEAGVAEAKSSVLGVQRSLAAQTSERRTAERRVKQLELDLSSALSAKASIEHNCQKTLQELEKRLAAAEGARKAAEEELHAHRMQLAPTRSKIEALGARFAQTQDRLAATERALGEAREGWAKERQARLTLQPRLKTAQDRVRELESELRITRETARAQIRRSSSRSSVDT